MTLKDKVRAVLAAHPDGITTVEVARIIGSDNTQAVASKLSKLASYGEARKVDGNMRGRRGGATWVPLS
jgi:hypothetical protein